MILTIGYESKELGVQDTSYWTLLANLKLDLKLEDWFIKLEGVFLE
jgi:hypothetical protein